MSLLAFWIFVGLHVAQRLDELPESESGGAGARDELARQLPQDSLPVVPGILHLPVSDECPRPLLGVEESADLHLAVGPGYGVGIDRKIDGHLPHRGQLIARRKRTGGNRSLYLVNELPVDGNAAVYVQPKGEYL